MKWCVLALCLAGCAGDDSAPDAMVVDAGVIDASVADLDVADLVQHADLDVVDLRAARMSFGANGHPTFGSAPVYVEAGMFSATLAQEQLELLASMGMTSYRVNVVGQPTSATNVAAMDQLVALASARGIAIMPIIDSTVDWQNDPSLTDIESSAYADALPFATRYCTSIHTYELENEQDLQLVTSAQLSGQSTSDYDTTNTPRIKALLRGLGRAVHDAAASPGCPHDLQTILDFAWVHFGFLDLMLQNVPATSGSAASPPVPVDVIAAHCYFSDSIDPSHFSPSGNGQYIDYFAQLASYKLPVIINEFNAPNGALVTNGSAQTDDVAQAKLVAKQLGYIEAQHEVQISQLIMYELLDETNVQSTSAEAHFGLYTQYPTDVAAHPEASRHLFADYLAYEAGGTVSTAGEAQLSMLGLVP